MAPQHEPETRRGWVVVAGAWCCLFTSFGWITCIGLFQDYYQAHQLRGYSASAIAWIPATQTFMMFGGAPVCGNIFDGHGPRGLVVAGTLLHVFGLMMVSLAREYYQFFLAQSVCSAAGASALFWGSNTAVGTWFTKRRALAMGVVSSGSGVGALVGTVMIPRLFEEVGFAWTIRIVAFMFLGLLSVAVVTVESRLEHTPKPFRPADFLQPLREKAVLLLAAASFFFFLGVFIPYNYLVAESVHRGMSTYLSTFTLTILSATSIFGRIIPGWLGDRYGRFNVMIATSTLSAAIVLALWIPARSNAPNLVFAALYGVSSGTFVAMVPALIAQVCSDMSRLGVYMGAVYLVASPAVLIGQPIAGALVGADGGDYTWLQVFCGVTMIVGGVLFAAARAAHGGVGAKRV